MTRPGFRLPRTQALTSQSFKAPIHLLEDTHKTVLDLYRWNAEKNSNHPLFRFKNGDDVRTIEWGEAVDAIRRAAAVFRAQVPAASQNRKPPVVAIFANSDTITYFCAIVGIFWAGFTAFPISPRNGAEAVADLLLRTDACCLYLSPEPRIASIADAAFEIIKDKTTAAAPISVHQLPTFDSIFSPPPGAEALSDPQGRDIDAPLIILHSSGSTAFPKPISWSVRRLKQWTLLPWYGDIDFTDLVMGCHAMPMFHGMGALQINSAASAGFVIACFKPTHPAIFPTPVNVFEEVVATGSDFLCCVPSFVEEWATDPSKVAYIKSSKGLIFGGGPLSEETGNRLAREGIALYQNYGCTEVGVMNTFLPDNPGMDWEYLEMSKQFRSEYVPQQGGTYELTVIADEIWRPAVINTKIGGRDAYATKDLFIPHKTKPNLWKIHGRADDQIMLSTGEKTNPGPLESILSQDPHIRSGVIFGRGRFHNGLIIDPVPEVAVDPRDENMLKRYRDLIWPTIERMNSFAPQHSRIFKEMIMVASPDKPFTYTAKGTTRRQTIIDDYAAEIDALYASVKTQTSYDIPLPASWDLEETLIYVRQLVTTVLNRQVEDDADIFQYGCDSLQAAWIQNNILRSLETSGVHVILPANLVYQALSIKGLAAKITTQRQLGSPAHAPQSDKVQELLALVARFTAHFPTRPTDLHRRGNVKDTVLLTGSTGGFGSHILVELVADSSVEKIYLCNRGPGSKERQLQSLQTLGLDVTCMSSAKLVFLEGDLSACMLGLGVPQYKELQESVTHIIHNAWKVDFNLTVMSFEKQLSGLRNLVDMALTSNAVLAPRLLFTSSAGIIRQLKTHGYLMEEPIHDPVVVIGIGYTEAKWVGERILEEANKVGLQSTIVRVGQLCGSENGYWNQHEWFPTVVQSAEYLHCLPDVDNDGLVSWIPSAQAARAILQMRHSTEPILHLTHAAPVTWRTIMAPISESLGVPLVPYAKWLAALEACLPKGHAPGPSEFQRYPALRLLDFYRNVSGHEICEPLGVARLDIRRAMQVGHALDGERLTAKWTRKWLRTWHDIGHLSTAGKAQSTLT